MRQMLTLHSINPTGMFSYGLSDNINLLNSGLVHLLGINEDKGGDSNGSGKSSLFNAVCELLFRENPTGEKSDSVVNALWGKGMAGRIYFTNWQGQHFRVTYCRDWKGQLYPADNDNNTSYVGTSLFLDKYESGSWKDFRGSGMPETHKKILEIIGMTYNQFVSTSYMSSRIGNQFLRGTNKERMDILSGITGIEEWDSVLEKSRAKKKALSTKIISINERSSYERGSIQTLQEQLQNAKAFNWDNHIKVLEIRLEDVRKRWKIENTKISQLNNQINELRNTQENSFNKEKSDAIKREIEDLQKTLRTYETDLSKSIQITDDQKLAMDLRTLANNIGQTKGILSAYCGSINTLSNMTNCPTCDAEIGDDVKNKLKDKIDTLNNTLNHQELDYKNLQEMIAKDKEARLKKEQKKREDVSKKANEVRMSISKKNNEINAEYENYKKIEAEIRELNVLLDSIKVELNRCNIEGTQINSQIENAKSSMENLKALEGQIEEKLRQVKFFEDEVKQVQEDLDVYLWLIDNIPYIKLHKMSLSMKDISDMVNQFFDEMGESTRIRISSFEEKTKKKNASDVKDLMKSEVKVEIIDGNKNISPNLYSDGEISKISMAVVRSLHEMANKRGQGCNIMMLDEVFSFVDQYNSQKISNSLTNLLNKGTVFLTDNSGNATSLVQFNHTWIARKKNGQTVLEMD